jgi:hypothetical protein
MEFRFALVMISRALWPELYNTPQKLDKVIRCMLACHNKKEARYGKKHAERAQWGF